MGTSHYTQHGDVRIHYLDSGGEDHGAPIVFVPGMTDVAADYAEVLPSFGRRVAVVEVRGHGRSDAPESGYDLPTLAGDVGAVVDAVTDGPDAPVHVMTFSRGTSCAVAWTVANAHRVRSLAIGDYVPEERVLTAEARRRLLDGRWRGTPVRDRLDVRAAQATFATAQQRSMWEALAPLQIPLLVVRSGGSVLVDDTAWARYGQLFPDAHLVEFDDSPHDIFRPERGRYPELVRTHVEGADRADRR